MSILEKRIKFVGWWLEDWQSTIASPSQLHNESDLLCYSIVGIGERCHNFISIADLNFHCMHTFVRDAKKVRAVKNGEICCVVAFVVDFFPALSACTALETIRERLFAFSFWFDSLPPSVLLPSCLSVFAEHRALCALSFVLLSHDLFAFYHKFCLLFHAAVALHLCAVPPPPPPSPPTTSTVWSIYRLKTRHSLPLCGNANLLKSDVLRLPHTTVSRMRHEPKMATLREREPIKLR